MITKEELKKKIQAAPEKPGCYLYKDHMGHVIYAGKSKMLKNRVASYFRNTNDEKIKKLVREISDVEYYVTETEIDALLHEYRFIKQYKPWFNSQLKRDMPYALLRVGRDTENSYATLSVAEYKTRDDDKAVLYFDCFYNEQDVKDTLVLLNRALKTPVCGASDFSKVRRACFNYHIGLCMAPCEGRADESEYERAIEDIVSLFEGKDVKRIAQLEKEMAYYSENMEYEKAGRAKELLFELRSLQRKGKRIFHYPQGRGVIVFLRAYREKGFNLYFLHSGVVYAKQRFEDGLDEAGLECILQNIASSRKSEPLWLADAIREIYADRLVVGLPEEYELRYIETAIRENYSLFVIGS